MPTHYAIIVAGGSGNRFGSELPKQFHPLAGKPMLLHCIDAHLEFDPDINIIIVLPEDHLSLWNEMVSEKEEYASVQTTVGGSQRYHSVVNGLRMIPHAEDSIIGIHDAARPLLTAKLIKELFETAAISGAVIPTIQIKDSIRKISDKGSEHKDRTNYRGVQTPQVFRSKLLLEAYRKPYEDWMTDDASVVEAAGTPINLIDGEESNIKVTTPMDMVVAEQVLDLRK